MIKPARLIASWIYGLVVTIRNLLYDEHLLPAYEPEVPTICIGNLTVGGTGKTPHTEYIARRLSQRFQVAILSRGYKRKTRGFLLADEFSTAQTIGDEPLEMYKSLNEGLQEGERRVIVAVSENRVQGIKRLQRLYPNLQVVVLDDAFQHRRLLAGFNILLTTADNLYTRDHFLPYGRLRDSRHSSLRANMVVVSKCPEQLQPIDRRVIETSLNLPQYQQLFFSYIRYSELRCMNSETIRLAVSDIQKPLVITGIEKPEPLIEYLKTRWQNLHHLAFADHHSFTRADYQRILLTYQQHGCNAIITTEKDASRMLTDKALPEQMLQVSFVAPIAVVLRSPTEGQDFMKPIIQYVTENNRKR